MEYTYSLAQWFWVNAAWSRQGWITQIKEAYMGHVQGTYIEDSWLINVQNVQHDQVYMTVPWHPVKSVFSSFR